MAGGGEDIRENLNIIDGKFPVNENENDDTPIHLGISTPNFLKSFSLRFKAFHVSLLLVFNLCSSKTIFSLGAVLVNPNRFLISWYSEESTYLALAFAASTFRSCGFLLNGNNSICD